MKKRVIKLVAGLFSLLLLEACSKSPTKESASAKNLPVKFSIVQSPDAKQRAELRAQAKTLFAAKNYEALEQLALECRQSGEFNAIGAPKFGEIYAGLDLSDDDPETAWRNQLAARRDWIKAKPDSITARVALADLLVAYAWKARGSGYSDTVTKQGEKLFEDRLNEAVQVLHNAASLQEKCPRYWSVLLQAALGLGFTKPQYDTIFQQAIRTNASYTAYYRSKAVYLLPRWYGQDGDTLRFLTEVADHLDREEGDLLYARVVWQLHSMQMFKNIFTEYDFSWERVERGFEVMEKRYSDLLSARSERAYLASLTGQGKVAHSLFDKLDGKIDLTVWHDRETFDRCAEWAYQQ